VTLTQVLYLVVAYGLVGLFLVTRATLRQVVSLAFWLAVVGVMLFVLTGCNLPDAVATPVPTETPMPTETPTETPLPTPTRLLYLPTPNATPLGQAHGFCAEASECPVYEGWPALEAGEVTYYLETGQVVDVLKVHAWKGLAICELGSGALMPCNDNLTPCDFADGECRAVES